MYICNECEEVFEQPKVVVERHPWGMGYAEEEFCECPCCGSGNFEEAEECSLCGEYVAELEDGLCNICYSDMND